MRRFSIPSVAALFLLAPMATSQPDQKPACAVLERSVTELQADMAAGTCTSRLITEAYLARIDQIDRDGPTLRSVLAVDPGALAAADALDAERAAGKVRGPLHGIPVLLKDNIETTGPVPTTAGAIALAQNVAERDAPIVAQLREAGAVILGKTNLSEWANFRSTRSSSGWSGLGGQTRNPYALDRSPCGSSSGTGAAIAASLAAVGVGTETDGSVVCPSSVNGLVGVKPTVGLVSRSGIVPLSHSQDTAGPMARSVRDAALLLSAMAGPDSSDAVTLGAERYATDYAIDLDENALRGTRIGVLRDHFDFSADAGRLAERAVDDLRAAGAVVIDSLALPFRGEYGADEYTVLLYDFKDDLNRYLANRPDAVSVRSLADVIAFNRDNAEQSMPYFEQEILEMADAKGPLTDSAYVAALERSRGLARKGLDSLLALHDLDALVAPTTSPAWPIDLVNGDHYLGSSSSPGAVSGYPSVTVPMGLAHGLPVGLSFIGGAYTEETLLKLAYAYEQATGRREPPRYLPTMPIAHPSD